MSSSVVVRLPARLHLGFLDPSGSDARRFGSIGLPLSEPETVVSLRRAPETHVEGPEAARAAHHLATMKEALGVRSHHRLTVEQAIPAHAGLGSGTQIALAVAAALRTLHGLPLDAGGDAMILSRGRRSGIGIASFDNGGIIIDAGQDGSGAPPPVVARMPFPEEWRVPGARPDHRRTAWRGRDYGVPDLAAISPHKRRRDLSIGLDGRHAGPGEPRFRGFRWCHRRNPTVGW